MAAKKHGLGRGLDALIPQNRPESSASKTKDNAGKAPAKLGESAQDNKAEGESKMQMVRITKVEPDRTQPRKSFNEEALKQLSDSIKKVGILEPLLVEKKIDHYEIIAGERRWRAAKLAGLKEVPIVIGEYDKKTKAEVQLIENVQREDINPIEEARAYKRLIEEYDLKQEEVAEAVSKSRAAVANSMRLLKLSEKVQDMLADPESGLTSGHARALITIENEEAQLQIAEEVVSKKLSVRDTEKLVKSFGKKKNTPKKEKDSSMEAIYRDIENKIRASLGTKASIISKGKGGKLEIEFYDSDSLDKILNKLL